jgi:hypothetical protein
MIIKANSKLSKFSSADLPCSSLQFGKLEDGKEVQVAEETGTQLISMGIANEVKNKKVINKKSQSKEKK